jgi:hypothetical protein
VNLIEICIKLDQNAIQIQIPHLNQIWIKFKPNSNQINNHIWFKFDSNWNHHFNQIRIKLESNSNQIKNQIWIKFGSNCKHHLNQIRIKFESNQDKISWCLIHQPNRMCDYTQCVIATIWGFKWSANEKQILTIYWTHLSLLCKDRVVVVIVLE